MGLLKTSIVHESRPMASNSTTTLQIPGNQKIQSLGLRFTTSGGADVTEAQLRAEVGNIRFTVNGRDLINCSAAALLDLYEMLGNQVFSNTGVAGVLELILGRLIYSDPEARDVFGLGTNNLQSIQVSVTALTLTNVANVQAFTERQAINENLGMYHKFIDYPINFNSTGDHTVDTLPRDQDSAYLFMMVSQGASGTITFGECRANSAVIKERTPASINNLFLSNNKFSPVAGYYVYQFNDSTLTSRLPMVGVDDFRIITTFSVAPGAAGYSVRPLTVHNMPNS